MALTTGTRLGRYEIRSPLGAGGMGEVYLARDASLQRDIAGPDAAGVTAFGPARMTPDGHTMVAGYSRVLSTLYRVTDLK